MTAMCNHQALLETAFTNYGTDKGIWGYTPYYAEVMGPIRFQVKKVLEIGICGYRDIPNNVVGASLFAWRDFFPNATIYGLDNDGRFIFNDQLRINTRLVDAYNAEAMDHVMAEFVEGPHDGFDMIVDDAVHEPDYQIRLATYLSRYLRPDGHYFIEEACPYKLAVPTETFFADHLDGFYSAVHACKTPKPEELMVLVK